ncbi:MAG: recombination mediator RecR [Pseudomonadota bacterium]
MSFTPLLTDLIDALRCLPGVGQKTAQRMAFALLEGDRTDAGRLAAALTRSADGIRHCSRCRMYCEDDLCSICANPARDDRVLCVVESPADVLAIDGATGFRGRYFVLLGHLSPLDGVGPSELGMELLAQRIRTEPLEEVIIATNPTVEGDATAHFVTELAMSTGVAVSRIAHGVPVGGELEFVDGGTLSHAFVGRRSVGQTGGS